jgi:hypothetical protein
MSKIPMDLSCVVVFRSRWFGEDFIVWVTSTTTTHEDVDVDRFILDEGVLCNETEWDKIFPRTWMSIDLVKLRMSR